MERKHKKLKLSHTEDKKQDDTALNIDNSPKEIDKEQDDTVLNIDNSSKEILLKQDTRVRNINNLPEELIIEIFKYLKLKERCRAGKVCKKWYAIVNYAVFWKKVSYHFNEYDLYWKGSAIMKFIRGLQPCLTHLKLSFDYFRYWSINLTTFFDKLQQKCPHLEVLILYRAILKVTEGFQSVLHTVGQFFPNMRILVIHHSILKRGVWFDNDNPCRLEVLDLSRSIDSEDFLFRMPLRKIMPTLKKLRLSSKDIFEDVFQCSPSCLSQLEILDLEGTMTGSATFTAVRKYCFNLTELYVCFTDIQDKDIIFKKPVEGLKSLKIVCFRACYVTFKGIDSLVKSITSLQHVYVGNLDKNSDNDFSKCNPVKVKVINGVQYCEHHSKVNYLRA